jgi:hypothetical protein
LMGALVTIPHHYLGFVFIGLVFISVILVPWVVEYFDDDIWGPLDSAEFQG